MGLVKLLQAGIKNKEILKGGFNFSKEKTKQFLDILKNVELTEKAAKRAAKMFTGKAPPSIPGNTRVYHGTDQPYKGEGFRTGTGVLFTSPNSKFVDSFTRSDKIGDLGKYISKEGSPLYRSIYIYDDEAMEFLEQNKVSNIIIKYCDVII